MKPLRLVLDARHIRDFGIGTYIRNLVLALARIDLTDEFTLVCSPSNEPDFMGLPGNFRVVSYAQSDQQLRDNVAFPMFVRKFGADLYHIPLNRVPFWMPRPYVVTIHDMSRHVFSTASNLRKQMSLWKSRRSLMRASRVMAVSAATRRDVEDIFNIPAARLRTIHNALDPRFLSFGRDESGRAERRRQLDRYQIHFPYVLYAGTIKPQKNVPRLIEAFAVARGELAAHPRLKDLRLVVIGDDISQNPAVRLAVNQTRTREHVRFLGFVSQETLQAFYESAEVFAFPSLYEGFGLPPLEAMACGTPVLTSNVSSLPEVVDDAAVMINPENVFEIARGMKDLLVDEALRARCIERGLARTRVFSWEKTAAQVLETYREVAREGGD